MTRKRALAFGLFGLLIAAAVAQAAWYYQNGRWYYTPDIGSTVTWSGVTGSTANAVWSLTTTRYGFACVNPAYNEASETVMVRTVYLGSSAQVDNSGKKKRRQLTLTTDINTDHLATPADSIYCINPNWHPDPDSVLVYEFTASVKIYGCQGTNGDCSTLQSQTNYACTLPGTWSPLNLPPGGFDYDCTEEVVPLS